MTTYNVLLA